MPVPVEIVLTFDDKGAVSAVRRIGEEGQKAGTAVKSGMAQGEKAAASLKDQAVAAAAGFVTAQAAIALVEGSIRRMGEAMRDAAGEQRQIQGLQSIMRDLGIDVAKGSDRVEEYALAMRQAGIEDGKTRDGIQRMLPITRDLETAIKAVNVAQGAAIKYNKDEAATLDLIAALMTGQERALIPAQKEYGVQLDKTLPKAMQVQQALDQLSKSTKGVAENTRDAASQQKRLGDLINESWEASGQDVNNTIEVFGRALGVAGLNMEKTSETIRSALPLFASLRIAASGVAKVLDTDLVRGLLVYQELSRGQVKVEGELGQQMTEEEAKAKGLANAKEILARLGITYKTSEEIQSAQVRASTEAMQAMVAATDAAAASRDRLWTQQGPVVSEGMAADNVIQLPSRGTPNIPDPQVVAMQAEEFLATYQAVYQDPLSVLDQQYRDAMLTADQMSASQRLMVEQAYYAEKKRLREMEAMAAREEVANRLSDAGKLFGGLAQLSGKNFKMRQAFQIGEAIVNGISAAIKSFDNGGGYPWGLIPMAASIATTAAQIAQIRAQKPPAYAQGTPYVPETGMALLHQGEAVIPRQYNPFAGSDSAQAGITVHVDARGALMGEDGIARLGEQLERAVQRGRYERRVA